MGQRLGIASALLGDPPVLVLDEPVNGLDPEGIRWVRDLLKRLAGEGRTVFVSSHLMTEMALTADHVILVGRGRVIADVATRELISGASRGVVLVRTPEAARLGRALTRSGVTVVQVDRESLEVTGLSSAEIGQVALDERIALHALTPGEASLEDAFLAMTRDAVDFHGYAGPAA
jgi:ABC-2 type transport system ATP-binding protein